MDLMQNGDQTGYVTLKDFWLAVNWKNGKWSFIGRHLGQNIIISLT